MAYKKLLQKKIQKRANSKLIEWFRQWCASKRTEYERVREAQMEQVEQTSTTTVSNESVTQYPVARHIVIIDYEEESSKQIRPYPSVVALYYFLKNHPVFKHVLAIINNLEDFIDLSVVFFWKLKGIDVKLIDNNVALITIDCNKIHEEFKRRVSEIERNLQKIMNVIADIDIT